MIALVLSRIAALACASLLASCTGDPLPPSRSPSDPSNPHAAEAPLAIPSPAPSAESATAAMSMTATPAGGAHDMQSQTQQGSTDAGTAAPPTGAHDMHDHAAHASADAGVTYTCPMHPEVQSSAPGRCPKCGMTLVVKKP